MESLYHSTNRALSELQSGMPQLESASASESDLQFQQTEREVQRRMEQILSNLDRLDVLVGKEPVTRRHNAKVRVDQLKEDARHLQAAIRAAAARRAVRAQEDRNREQLLTMRFTTNAAAAAANAAAATGSGSETSLLIDRALEHQNALDRSNRGLDDLLGQGATMLETLRDQRENLKGIQKKMLDIASTLGMSTTVMRLIERRQEGDKYVLFGGMVATCVVMFLVWKFLA